MTAYRFAVASWVVAVAVLLVVAGIWVVWGAHHGTVSIYDLGSPQLRVFV